MVKKGFVARIPIRPGVSQVERGDTGVPMHRKLAYKRFDNVLFYFCNGREMWS